MSWFVASGAQFSASVCRKGLMRRIAGRRFDVGATRNAAAAITLAPTLAQNLGQTARVGLRASHTGSYGRFKHTT